MIDYPTHRSIRQRVELEFDDGVQGTTTSLGTTTTALDTSRVETTDYWRGGELLQLEGADDGLARRVTASTTGTGLTTAAFPNAVPDDTDYELVFNFNLTQYNNAIYEAVRRARSLHWIPWWWDGLVIVADTYDYDLPFRDSRVITIDVSSDVNTLLDSALTQPADYWNGSRVVGLSGTAGNLGVVRYVEDFNATTDALELHQDLPATPAAADTYQLTRFKPARLVYVEYIPSGGTLPQQVDFRNWTVVSRPHPMIRFQAGTMPPVDSTVRIYGYREPEVPSNDYHPVEVPEDYAVNQAYWQLLRSRPRRPDFLLDANDANKREAWDKATLDLNRGRTKVPAQNKRVP